METLDVQWLMKPKKSGPMRRRIREQEQRTCTTARAVDNAKGLGCVVTLAYFSVRNQMSRSFCSFAKTMRIFSQPGNESETAYPSLITSNVAYKTRQRAIH